jgi:anti-anti-sigma factor
VSDPQAIPVTHRLCENAATLSVRGELTLANLLSFRQNVLDTLTGVNTLTLSLAGAEYLDAAAFQCLAGLRVEVSSRGATLLIKDASDAIRHDATQLGMIAVLDGSAQKKGN